MFWCFSSDVEMTSVSVTRLKFNHVMKWTVKSSQNTNNVPAVENFLLSFIKTSWVQYDKVSPAFTSQSQSSWYRLTRPRATFRQIKTYFASCLFDWRLLVLAGVLPCCCWYTLDLLPEALSSTCSLVCLLVESGERRKSWSWETAGDGNDKRRQENGISEGFRTPRWCNILDARMMKDI